MPSPSIAQLIRTMVIVLTLSPSVSWAQQDVSIPWQGGWVKAFNEGADAGTLTAKLYRPAGDAPVPFIVFLHGCDGASVARQGHWADFFVQRGVGFLLVDSLSARDQRSICQDSKNPWVRRRADDAMSALTWLQSQPFVNKDRIALMGQSHGGGAALLALHEGTARGKGFVAGLLMYPACGYGNAAKVRLARPTLVLIGGDDNWTPVSQCETLKAAQSNPSIMEIVVYPGAAHSFDNPGKQMVVFDKYRVGEHPASRDAARVKVAQWVDAVLKR